VRVGFVCHVAHPTKMLAHPSHPVTPTCIYNAFDPIPQNAKRGKADLRQCGAVGNFECLFLVAYLCNSVPEAEI